MRTTKVIVMANSTQPALNTSPVISDTIKQTTCYMCACRCGIDVHIQDNKVKYIEGNKNHPVNNGVLCAKGAAGIMQHYSPARLSSPLKRVGPRGSGKFKKISWREALELTANILRPLRKSAPEQLAFFTGRDQSQSFTGWWAQQFGTPNYAAHGGFCSVNMAAAGIYTLGGSFWEFGSPDWDRTKLLVLLGVAEDHDSNPIKIGLGKLKARGAKIIGVNPVRTGYNAIADDWISITPGTDGLLILSLIHLLFKRGNIDLKYLRDYTNATFLVNREKVHENYGLFLRDKDGKPQVLDKNTGKVVAYDQSKLEADLTAEYQSDNVKYVTVFNLMAEKYMSDDYMPERIEKIVGISSKKIKSLADELATVAFKETIEIKKPWVDWKGNHHEKMIGRPISFHAMRGISAHANGFQTCRSLHLLQILLGSVEVPGGFRLKPPYPKPSTAHPKPHFKVTPGKPLDGPHLGFVHGPEDLAINKNGTPIRIDKAFTWENPMSPHGMMQMVISNAHAGDPYKINTLFLYMANMAWNSSMNTSQVIEMLTDCDSEGNYVIPNIIYSDSYSSEMVAFADIVLPDTTYLERHDCISLLDRPISEPDAMSDAIRWPVVEPERDVRAFQSVLLELGVLLNLPEMTQSDGTPVYNDYADYIQKHERRPGIGPLSGFRGIKGSKSGRGEPNPDQLNFYIKNGGFWTSKVPEEARFFKPWNKAYQEWAIKQGLADKPQPYVFQIYLEPMRRFQRAAEGFGDIQPPAHLRQQIRHSMEPLPSWCLLFSEEDNKKYPLHAITQRPPAMYHSWGSHNAWLRQIHGMNPLYVPNNIWIKYNFSVGDWAYLKSSHGQIKVPVARMAALNENTVWTWNAIGKRRGAWALDKDAPEATKGFLINHLINELLPQKTDGFRWANADPITGQAAWYDLKVNIEKAPPEAKISEPLFPEQESPVDAPPKIIRYGEDFK